MNVELNLTPLKARFFSNIKPSKMQLQHREPLPLEVRQFHAKRHLLIHITRVD
jgi:hypothetical protein